MDIDAAGLITLKKMGHPVSPKMDKKFEQIIRHIPMEFILKGVTTIQDTLFAVESGADAIVVSNHGGRMLDYTLVTCSVLPDIASSVNRKREDYHFGRRQPDPVVMCSN